MEYVGDSTLGMVIMDLPSIWVLEPLGFGLKVLSMWLVCFRSVRQKASLGFCLSEEIVIGGNLTSRSSFWTLLIVEVFNKTIVELRSYEVCSVWAQKSVDQRHGRGCAIL